MWKAIESQAVVPFVLEQWSRRFFAEVTAFVSGLLLICVLAQVAIPLPWTPVPITGQTFGVTLVALSWGRKRALRVILSYLVLGGMGLPVFALGKSGLVLGPTLGYLIGMAAASLVVGHLADKGFTNSFKKSFLAAHVGSAIVFAFGLFGLSFFVPKELLLSSGLLPFLPGDFIKNTLAAALSSKAKSFAK